MDNKTRNTLANAAEEIRSLRRDKEILAAKVEVMDLFACVLHTTPAGRSGAMGEDIVWKIEGILARDEADRKTANVTAAA